MDLELPALFKLFVQERKYLKNVTPQTIEWYEVSWKMLGSRFAGCRTTADIAAPFLGRLSPSARSAPPSARSLSTATLGA